MTNLSPTSADLFRALAFDAGNWNGIPCWGCNVGGSTGYILASRKSLDCVFLSKDGTQSAQYTGSIDKVGVDIGYTKAIHTIWRVYSLGSDRAATTLSGTYVGEQTTAAVGGQAGDSRCGCADELSSIHRHRRSILARYS